MFLHLRIATYFETGTGCQLPMGGYEERGGSLGSAVGPPAGGDPIGGAGRAACARGSQQTDRKKLLTNMHHYQGTIIHVPR